MEASKLHSTDILIVDDDSINAKLLSYWCAKWGYSTEVTFSGKEALNKSINQEYKLIILDIVLPDISGIEVAQRINNLNRPTEIIFQSGLSETEYRARTNEPYLFLQKPYAPSTMAETISFVMDKYLIKASA